MRLPVRVLHLFSALAIVALGSGCAGNHDATAKELAELRAEVTRLRAAQATLGERVDGLEIDRGAFGKGAPSAAPKPTSDRPELTVVRLSPSEGDGDADSQAPRPLIRAVGNDGSIQKKAKDAQPRKGAARPTVKP